MGRKRLITDSFQVVKKRKRDSKEVKEAQSPPHETVTVQEESVLQDAIQPDQLETLKQFDLSWEYGPCTGITRLQRWERAESLGLSPPATVRELLLKHREDSIIMHSLWHEYSL
ncbi:DNA polymerase delta subunit 4-like [Tiliqua scincoides]|uniref:DNA polymerase delta subunit 4-like n=1 Tax=Tiliqua scincoides TaxID=71010 RepID=UPI00346269AA